FYFSEPGGGAPLYNTPDKEYEIPEWETNEELKKVIDESMRQGKDLLVERYKDFEFILVPNFYA
ncbi:MAG: hypothetical protein LBO67_09835, partial [Spirochaetaceae bacterium]|nr:hypothetical protein [Spirochaetaceae bacterium]